MLFFEINACLGAGRILIIISRWRCKVPTCTCLSIWIPPCFLPWYIQKLHQCHYPSVSSLACLPLKRYLRLAYLSALSSRVESVQYRIVALQGETSDKTGYKGFQSTESANQPDKYINWAVPFERIPGMKYWELFRDVIKTWIFIISSVIAVGDRIAASVTRPSRFNNPYDQSICNFEAVMTQLFVDETCR